MEELDGLIFLNPDRYNENNPDIGWETADEYLSGNVRDKLKLSGGDIKAVQGDSGHAQADMVTEVYSHIIDEDRRRNATLLEDSFYNRKNLNPQIHDTEKRTMMEVPEGVDAELLAKVLSNPEMAVLLTSLAKSMQGEHN